MQDASQTSEGRFLTEHDPFFNHAHQRSGDGTGRSSWSRIRRGLLVSIGFGSLLLGAVLVVTTVSPETLQTMSTIELAGILGLVCMPVLTMLSIAHDRTVVKRAASSVYKSVVSGEPAPRVRHRSTARSVPAVRLIHHARASDPIEKASPEPVGSL
tara:strand:+ start:73255 stop:73722 length:468 start_codon:yes stop_codon:yes gene_type:complete